MLEMQYNPSTLMAIEPPSLAGLQRQRESANIEVQEGLPVYTNSARPSLYDQLFGAKTFDITAQIETLLSQIALKVTIPHPDEARDYLLRHPDVMIILRRVCDAAWTRFGTNSQLSLEVYLDPEIEDEHLTLYVRQENYDEHILDMIENIWTLYEDDHMFMSGWLLVTTDFCPP